MKKVFFFLAVFCASAITLQAQSLSFDLREQTKSRVGNDFQFIGCDNQHIVLVERTGRFTQRYSLASYDMDQNEQARVELGNEKELDIYGGYLNGTHIDLLQVKYPEGGMLVYRDRRSLSTLQPEGDTLFLGKYQGEKSDDYAFGIASSPNGELLAGVFVANRVGQGIDVKVGLYNHELEEYWTMTPKYSTFNAVAVNDEGDVILYGFGSEDHQTSGRRSTVGRQRSTDNKCRFVILDGERTQYAEFELPSDLNAVEHQFLRYGNNKILVAATVCEENQLVMPVGSNIDGIAILCYDIEKKRLSVERHPFTDQETHRLLNTKEGRSVRRHWVQFGQIAQTISDKDGAYVMVDNTWSLSVNGTKTEQCRMGIMVLRVDTDGKVQWVRTHRYSGCTTWENRHLISFRWRVVDEGVMLLWADNARNLDIPFDKSYKDYTPPRCNSVLNALLITPTGNESRSHVPIDRQVLNGSFYQIIPSDTPTTTSDAKYMALLQGRRSGQVAIVSLTTDH